MNLGERLTNLRKKKQLSQEEVAEKLGVTRQTISKWETDQSLPDFDKIVPISELYNISTNYLLTGEDDIKETVNKVEENDNKRKKTLGIIFGILLYFVAIAWIMVSVAALNLNSVISSAIFLLICGVATCIIVYVCIMYKTKKENIEEENSTFKQIKNILSIITTIIYLLISFITMAWHITWIIWLIYALIIEIVKLIINLKEETHEK